MTPNTKKQISKLNLDPSIPLMIFDADEVLVADVYAAGETPIAGISRDALVSGLRDHGHKAASALLHRDDLAIEIKARTSGGDLVMCLGAGDITNWAANLPDELEKLGGTE